MGDLCQVDLIKVESDHCSDFVYMTFKIPGIWFFQHEAQLWDTMVKDFADAIIRKGEQDASFLSKHLQSRSRRNRKSI